MEASMVTNFAPRAANPSRLGALWVVYGVVRLAVGVLLILESGVATVMFGALLSRVGDPFLYMAIFHFLYAVIIVITLISGILGVLAGLALLGRGTSVGSLPVIASVFSVSDLPLGTTLGIYTLIDFLR
jgi:hypothetical protein